MLLGVAPLPPSFPPTAVHWNTGILHYKQAKLRKDMQHSVARHEHLFLDEKPVPLKNLSFLLVPPPDSQAFLRQISGVRFLVW